MKTYLRTGAASLIAALLLQLMLVAHPAVAADGDLIADVVVPDTYPTQVAPSVAFDGTYLYYLGYGTPVLNRIDVPPAGGTTFATGHTATPIIGAQGIMTLAYDAGRDKFWAVGSDGLSIYLLTKSGAATLAYTVDPVQDRPGFQTNQYATEVKIAYDRSDDTIWYSPDATGRIYHYSTTADALGTAQLVSASPYIDVNVPPNDMTAQCGYSQSSGVVTGGTNLFVSVAGCFNLFEYSKTGTKLAWHPFNTYAGGSPQEVACDNLSYVVPVFWVRDAWDGHIRAFEQPGSACLYGGGVPASPAPSGRRDAPRRAPGRASPANVRLHRRGVRRHRRGLHLPRHDPRRPAASAPDRSQRADRRGRHAANRRDGHRRRICRPREDLHRRGHRARDARMGPSALELHGAGASAGRA